nr:helicase-related protein [Nitrosomonas nitrosa]
MARLEDLIPNASVEGIVPNAPVTVVSAIWHGTSVVELTYKQPTGGVDHVLLYRDDEARLRVAFTRRPWAFDADGATFRLVSESYRISLAALFDPLLAVHTSLVEPLPHQILAVYERMIPRQPLRFLLADDPGAGKTIMAGLFIKELIARGDLERCLIVCPGSLAEQWQDELDSKFQLPFDILTNDKLETARTGNWLEEADLVIARLDKLSRDEDVQAKLTAAKSWDLVIVDEAHKMSASVFGNEVKYTRRYRLGQLLSGKTRHLLLMTATPHNGKDEDFQLFMALLDGDRFEGQHRDGAHTIDCSDLMRRLVKEQLFRFDGTLLFPERRAYTVGYELSDAEARLYKDVTDYVREEFNRADKLENEGRKGTIGFALTILQRRLASSPEAIYQSLRRRRERLENDLREARLLQRGGKSAFLEHLKQRELSEDELTDLQDADESTFDDVEAKEDEVATEATTARTIEELQLEIEILKRLEISALALKRSGVDKKWEELSRLLQDTPEMFEASGHRRKLIVFSEHRDTVNYLVQRIGTLLGRPEAIVTIMGGMGREKRRAAEESFKQDKEIEILIANDAAGEGINLQRAHLMVNYDLPWNPNRLEQRFGRIHRIGQTEVCHVWNLLAHETREGEVYRRLLEKLEAQRAALGGRVYDVLGRPLFEGTSLRNLLIEAVRYGDQPDVRARLLQRVDNATDQARVRELLDKDALVRDSLDARRVQLIREDMERAEAKRLQPHYIQAFFMEAFQKFGGQISEREKGRFEVTRVPASVRNRDRQIGRGSPVLPRYERVAFEKSLINVQGKPTAAFLCPGHPLLDAVIDLLLEQHRPVLRQGTILIDPNDPTDAPRALFYLEHAIRDAVRVGTGDSRTISRELQFIEIDQAGSVRSAGSAPYLDYRPADAAETELIRPQLDADWLTDRLEQKALEYAVEHVVPIHLRSVREQREELIDKTKSAVVQRLTREITYWDHRAQELLAREQAGKTPKLNSTKARQNADDLEARLKRRTEQLDRERQISPVPPVAIGGAIVVPQGLLSRLAGEPMEYPGMSPEQRDRINRLAVDAVLAAERSLGREPREMDHCNPGYDIESRDPLAPGRLRFIEVKGKAEGKTTVTVSATQIRTALNKPEDWILAIVSVEGDKAGEPRYCACPFSQPPDFAEVSKTLNLASLLKMGTGPM